MALPDVPSPFRPATPVEQPWWWEMCDASGAGVVVPDELAEHRFASQADAESWIGLTWQDLADAGVSAVVLHEHERRVYGPMSLEA